MPNLNQLADKKIDKIQIKKKKYYFFGALISFLLYYFCFWLPVAGWINFVVMNLLYKIYENPYQFAIINFLQYLEFLFIYLVILSIIIFKSKNNIKYKLILKGYVIFPLIALVLIFLYGIIVIPNLIF
jgi:hypothetical protein